MITKGQFKIKGTGILSQKPAPQSIKDFLEDSATGSEDTNAQNHKTVFPQKDNSTSNRVAGPDPEIEVVRLHVQIRKDLGDKLFAAVFERKRNRRVIREKATQREIIEEALEEYFRKHDIQ